MKTNTSNWSSFVLLELVNQWANPVVPKLDGAIVKRRQNPTELGVKAQAFYSIALCLTLHEHIAVVPGPSHRQKRKLGPIPFRAWEVEGKHTYNIIQLKLQRSARRCKTPRLKMNRHWSQIKLKMISSFGWARSTFQLKKDNATLSLKGPDLNEHISCSLQNLSSVASSLKWC